MPTFDDKFFIYAELKRILCTLIMAYIGFFVTLFFRFAYPESVGWTISYFITILFEFFAMSYATIWVAHKVVNIIHSHQYHLRKFDSKSINDYVSIDSPRTHRKNGGSRQSQRSITSHSVNNINALPLSTKIDNISPKKENYSLEVLLSSNLSFSSYMIQLAHEFSQEVLLAFIEFIQYQQYISLYINEHNLILKQKHHKKPPTPSISIHNDYRFLYNRREYYEVINFPYIFMLVHASAQLFEY